MSNPAAPAPRSLTGTPGAHLARDRPRAQSPPKWAPGAAARRAGACPGRASRPQTRGAKPSRRLVIFHLRFVFKYLRLACHTSHVLLLTTSNCENSARYSLPDHGLDACYDLLLISCFLYLTVTLRCLFGASQSSPRCSQSCGHRQTTLDCPTPPW